MTLRSFNPRDVIYSTSPPTDNIKLGQLWADTDASPPTLYICTNLLPITYEPVGGGGGGGGGAPTNASYVTLSLDSTLTQERTLAVESGVLTLTDDGANNPVTVGVAANGISNAKFRQSAGTSVVGRSAGTTGNVADIVAGADGEYLRRSSGTLGFGSIADADLPATVVRTSRSISTTAPLSGGGNLSADRTLSINTNGITNSLLRQGAGTSVIGRSANTTGDVADIAASADGQYLRRSSGSLGFGSIADGDLPSTIVRTSRSISTTAPLSGGGNLSSDLTLSVATFTASTSGIVPASGGGTSNFLRADGTWAAPPGGGGGGSPGGSDRQIQFNNSGSFGGASRAEVSSDGDLRIVATNTLPTAPSSNLVLNAWNRAGLPILTALPPSTRAPQLPLMFGLFGARHSMHLGASSGTSAPTAIGVTPTTVTTISFQYTASSSNRWLSTPRKRFTSAATAGSGSGHRAAYTFIHRGSAAGYGGFFFYAQVGHSTNTTGYRLFCGLCASTAVLAADPSSLTNMIGIGYDAADTSTGNWQLMYNDGTGTATRVDLGTNAARAADQGFELYILNPPNSGTFYVTVVNINTGTVVYDSSVSTDVPAADTGLTYKAETHNGAVAAAATVETGQMFLVQF